MKVKMFDYGNDILGEVVTVIEKDDLEDLLIYKTSKGEDYSFSGQGFYEEVD